MCYDRDKFACVPAQGGEKISPYGSSLKDVSEYELFKQLHASPGMVFINRKKIRAFSLNIFRGNLSELLKGCDIIENPAIGLKLMSDAHRGAGVQAHMEVNRLFHNFLAAAKSLIDHTRVFVDDHYKDTSLAQAYAKKVQSELAQDPLCRFIQDLRNYMLHKALPNSSMSLTISRIEGSNAQDILTTVSLGKEQLLQWDKWSSHSKLYLKNADKQIKISLLSREYGDKIIFFYDWFDAKLEKHHKNDMKEFQKLRKKFELLHMQEQEERRKETNGDLP